MTKEARKAIGSATVAMLALGGFFLGSEMRARQDLGSAGNAVPYGVSGLVASNDNQRSVTESDYFYQLTLLLEREFVEPIDDERKLAIGAVKGMVAGLLEPASSYYKQPEFDAVLKRSKGEYAGIGVELEFRYDQEELKKAQSDAKNIDPLLLLPDVVVTCAHGSAAEAGLRPGDKITGVDGKFILSSTEIKRLRKLQADALSGKIPPAQFEIERKKFQDKTDKSMSLGRVRELLTSGSGKSMEITWERGGQTQTKRISTGVITLSSLQPASRGFRLFFIEGAAEALKSLGENPQEIDLRNSGTGDFVEMQKCLTVVCPPGRFGTLKRERKSELGPLMSTIGPDKAVKLRLVVDSSTTGAARIFAAALKARGVATLQGELTGRNEWIETYKLADGSGYTLMTAVFDPSGAEAAN